MVVKKTKKLLKGGNDTIIGRLQRQGAVKLLEEPSATYLASKGVRTGSTAQGRGFSTKTNLSSKTSKSSSKSSQRRSPPLYENSPDYRQNNINNNSLKLSENSKQFIKTNNYKGHYLNLLLNVLDENNIDHNIRYYKTAYEILELVKQKGKDKVINLINNIQ